MDVEFTFYYLSGWQWFALALFCASSLLPAARILRRIGVSGWWAAFFAVPVLNVLALWALAYIRWPAATPSPAS